MATHAGYAFATPGIYAWGGQNLGFSFGGDYFQGVSAEGAIISLDPPEGPLDADENLARWKAITIVFDVPAGHTPMLMVKIGEDSGVELVAWNGIAGATTPNDGWSPLFRTKSTMTVDTNGGINGTDRYTAVVLPNAGWHRPRVVFTPFSGHEVVES